MEADDNIQLLKKIIKTNKELTSVISARYVNSLVVNHEYELSNINTSAPSRGALYDPVINSKSDGILVFSVTISTGCRSDKNLAPNEISPSLVLKAESKNR